MKKIFILLFNIFVVSCPGPDSQPVETADWSVSQISVGQQDGKVVLSWRDPAAPGLIEIGIEASSGGITVREQKIKPGEQTAFFDNLEKGKTYVFKLTGYGQNSQKNEKIITHTVSSVDGRFTQANVYDLTADFIWDVEPIPAEAVLTLETEEGILGKITDNRGSINVFPGADCVFHLTVTNGNVKETIASYQDRSLLFWDDFSETGTTDGPNSTRWKNPGPAGSAWNNALVKDWSMVEFLKDTDNTTFIRFKGSKNKDEKSKGSAVHSKDLFYFTYGKIEFRARLKENDNQGHFPALWLMPQKSGRPDGLTWPLGGEIDVMEHVRRNTQISQTVHSEKTSPAPFYAGDHVYVNAKGERSSIGSYKDWENWHVFAMEWTKDGLFWYLDGKHTRTFNKNMNDPAWYPFTEESAFYIIMNMGVGRASDGYPGGALDGFSAHMDVDYVRVTPNNDTIVRDCPYYKQ